MVHSGFRQHNLMPHSPPDCANPQNTSTEELENLHMPVIETIVNGALWLQTTQPDATQPTRLCQPPKNISTEELENLHTPVIETIVNGALWLQTTQPDVTQPTRLCQPPKHKHRRGGRKRNNTRGCREKYW